VKNRKGGRNIFVKEGGVFFTYKSKQEKWKALVWGGGGGRHKELEKKLGEVYCSKRGREVTEIGEEAILGGGKQ